MQDYHSLVQREQAGVVFRCFGMDQARGWVFFRREVARFIKKRKPRILRACFHDIFELGVTNSASRTRRHELDVHACRIDLAGSVIQQVKADPASASKSKIESHSLHAASDAHGSIPDEWKIE